jgi:hypothetical protein
MKTLILILAMLAPTLASSAENQNCSVGFGEYGALHFSLPSKEGLFKSLEQKQLAKNKVNEIAVLKNGVRVEIIQTGCTHHTTTIRVSNLSIENQTDVLEQAKQFLKTLPAEKGSQLLIISDELNHSDKSAGKQEDFRCGAGNCTLKREKGLLEIIYDFAV